MMSLLDMVTYKEQDNFVSNVVKQEKCIKQETMDKAISTYISVLKAEIEHLKTKLEPHDTGHIHTTISTLTHRVKELESKSS